MIGLKRGTVMLCPHKSEWETEAQRAIHRLKSILGSVAKDIQHVGSTSITSIMAKPIIDIAVAVESFEQVLALENELKREGFYYRPKNDMPNQILLACGSHYDGTGDIQTHFIHVVYENSMEWINYINFRDYLNKNPSVAKEYENIKISLARETPIDSGREKYLAGKHDFIVFALRKALVRSLLGKTVEIRIDRPSGSVHPKHPSIVYPVNYGFIPGIMGGDGEELDVYLLGTNEPIESCKAKIIGIIHRLNDTEDKLVASLDGQNFTADEIKDATMFQEKYYDTEIEILI